MTTPTATHDRRCGLPADVVRALHGRTVAVDLDDVTADFLGAFRPLVAQALGVPAQTLAAPADYRCADWGLSGLRHYRDVLDPAVLQQDFFATLAPLPDAIATIRALTSVCRVVVVTARAQAARTASAEIAQTARWLDLHGLAGLEVHFTARKNAVAWDVLVDDAPHNLGQAIRDGRPVVAFDQAWNRPADTLVRATSWADVPAALAGAVTAA